MTTKRIVMSIFVMVLAIVGTIAITNTAKAVTNVPTITRDMTVGTTGDDVKSLQQFLNNNGYTIATTGAGSKGNETNMFGNATKAALAKFQAANGLVPTGNLGSETRAILIKLLGTQTTTVTTNTNTATTDYSAKITALTNEIATLKSQITTLQSQVKTLQTQVNNLDNNDDEDDDEEDEDGPSVSSIKIYADGDGAGIDEGDRIVVTFNKAIKPESVNEDLKRNSSYLTVDYSEIAGVKLSSQGVLTINGIAKFFVGDVDKSSKFDTKIALDSSGKVLTIILDDGEQVDIVEDFDDGEQIDGDIKDTNNNEMPSDDVNQPTGTFGQEDEDDEDEEGPSISSIKIYDDGDADGIDEGDRIVITFSEAIDPESISSDLEAGDYVEVDSDETGGIILDDDGILTINDIAQFSVGDVDDNTTFDTKVALNSTGKTLTITLLTGDQVDIDEDFNDAEQIGGTIENEDGNEMSDDDINDPTGTFGA